jgi:antitoxin HicB
VKNADKTFEYYMSLPYRVVLEPSPEGGWITSIPNLPGCITQGETQEEALHLIEDAKAGWIDIALQDGDIIPEPDTKETYSGKFLVRIPKSLHKEIAVRAKKEAVSINQLATYFFSAGIAKDRIIKS